MIVSELVSALKFDVISGADALHREISGAYVSDLLSDVMGNAKAGQVWITLQTHKNVMAIASLKDLAAVIVIKGGMPDPDTLKKSQEEGIPFLRSSEDAFPVAGRIYEFLKQNGIV